MSHGQDKAALAPAQQPQPQLRVQVPPAATRDVQGSSPAPAPSPRTALLQRRSYAHADNDGGGGVRSTHYGSTSQSGLASGSRSQQDVEEHGGAAGRRDGPDTEGHDLADDGAAADAPRPSSLRSVRTHTSVVYSKNNVLDLRAAQRTFDGSYARTALGQLSYSVVILRLFQSEFYLVGIAYVALAVVLLILSIMRYKLTMESPEETIDEGRPQQPSSSQTPRHREEDSAALAADNQGQDVAVSPTTRRQSLATQASVHSHHTPRHVPKINDVFRTAGDVVAFATVFILALQIALLVLILKL
ncbi:hypothetical protein OC844_004790 [Tilletia horrida]|nr:hypothetical protein OC844_004790 [Tilletia horrida]